jgi:hypothetical protein
MRKGIEPISTGSKKHGSRSTVARDLMLIKPVVLSKLLHFSGYRRCLLFCLSGVREGAEFSISVISATSFNYTIFRQKEEDKEVSLNFEEKKISKSHYCLIMFCS